jgi:hypothetical protein
MSAAGFAVTAWSGFVLAAHGPAGPHVAALVSRHVLFALPAVLLSLFSQSMVIFYFIGTGRLVKDEIAGFAPERRRVILGALRRFKAKSSPPATFAMLSAIAVFVAGGWTHTTPRRISSLPHWAHLAAALLALGIHLWALAAEWDVFRENASLMADPAAYAAARASG